MSEQDALYSLIESGELLAVNGLEDTENGESSEGINTVHVCQHCNKVFLKNSNYQTHLRTHTGEKPFVCCICMKQFARADYLKAHLVSHTGARPYTCGICDKTFTHVSSLNTHIRIHTGERPYVCHICPRSFTKSSDLQRHLDIHREKLYTCFMCDKRFARVITLKKHLERCSSCFEDLSSPNSSILKYRGGSYQTNDRKMKRRKNKMEGFDVLSSDEESVNKKIDETIKIGDHSEKEEPSVENNDLFIISPGNSLIQNSFDPTKTTFLIIPSQQNSFLLNGDLFKSNNITLPLQTLTLDLGTSNML